MQNKEFKRHIAYLRRIAVDNTVRAMDDQKGPDEGTREIQSGAADDGASCDSFRTEKVRHKLYQFGELMIRGVE